MRRWRTWVDTAGGAAEEVVEVDAARTFVVWTPRPAVTTYLQDLERIPEWDRRRPQVVRIDDGPIGVGARWRAEDAAGHGPVDYRMVRHDPGHLIFVGENRSLRSTEDFTIVPVAEGTAVTYTVRIDLRGTSRVVGRLRTRDISGAMDEMAALLTRNLEALGG